jgi:hypothetical protein
MNAQIAAYERRLRQGALMLAQLEGEGRIDSRYERLLRQWQALVAAYEYETDLFEAGSEMALAAGF